MKVVNIIPTYNEKENIGRMLDALLDIAKKNPKYHFAHLVVDDNSPDGTAEIVKQYMKKYKEIELITGPKKGLGWALIRGYQHAMDKMGAEVIIPNDVDFQFDPYKIPELLAKIDEGYDVVVASRHIAGGGVEKWSLYRKLNHLLANDIFAGIVAGVSEVKDHSGNFKAIRVANLRKVALNDIKVTGFGFQNYILYELSKTGAKFTEVPTIFRERKAGKSKLIFRDAIEWMKSCVIIRLERSQRFIKFAVVGFIGYLVNASTLAAFSSLSFPEWLAWGLSTELAIISNFTWNNLWTFSAEKFTKASQVAGKFLQFNLTSAGALLIQTIAGTLGVMAFGPQYRQLLLPVIIAFLVLPYNYFMYTVVIWKVRKQK